MKEWWQSLSLREQLILAGGGVIALIIFFYLLIWSPFTDHIQTLRQRSGDNAQLLHWMQTANQELTQLHHAAPPANVATPADLLNVVDQSAQQNKLKSFITQLAQADNNKVDVKFTQVPFDDVIKWLITLWQQHRIEVDQMTVSPKGDGIVQMEVMLKVR